MTLLWGGNLREEGGGDSGHVVKFGKGDGGGGQIPVIIWGRIFELGKENGEGEIPVIMIPLIGKRREGEGNDLMTGISPSLFPSFVDKRGHNDRNLPPPTPIFLSNFECPPPSPLGIIKYV